MKKGDKVSVTIEKMSLHGGGVTRVDGFVLFVEFAAPGDELVVEITELRKKHGFAKILNVVKASRDRKTPPCPVYGRCGGCNWQHLADEKQAAWKQALVKESFAKAGVRFAEFLPLIQSKKTLRYRNRIQLKKRGAEVGYFESGSHRLVPIQDCPLAEEPLVPAIAALARQPLQPKSLEAPDFENWEISLAADHQPQIRQLDQRELAFSQVNRFVNELLVEKVLSWSADSQFDVFWDLYCGSGNFTFPFLSRFPKTSGLGVELSSSSIKAAQTQAQNSKISPKKLEFYRSDVSLFLKRRSPPSQSLVLVDPPRAGLDESIVQALAHSEAKTILYISCDPMSLTRDLARFEKLAPGRWTISRAQLFDMFPQTDHVETLVELKR
ncbi:MAG: class I SAM-dependent RNA methyltransferase [Bdellovibrio sp.]|jgi:23S rRNA (uracil1939-C5)-methyltransferase